MSTKKNPSNPNRMVESYEAKMSALDAAREERDRFLAARGPGHFGVAPTMTGTGLERGVRG